MPGVVAVELLLARTDTAAIALTGIRAFPTGFEFTLSSVARTDDGSAERMFHLTMRDRPLVAGAPIPTTSSGSASSTPTAESPQTRPPRCHYPMTRTRSGHCFSLRAEAAAGDSPR